MLKLREKVGDITQRRYLGSVFFYCLNYYKHSLLTIALWLFMYYYTQTLNEYGAAQ